jgi:hypothetical protein
VDFACIGAGHDYRSVLSDLAVYGQAGVAQVGEKAEEVAAVPVVCAQCSVFLAPIQILVNDFGNSHGLLMGTNIRGQFRHGPGLADRRLKSDKTVIQDQKRCVEGSRRATMWTVGARKYPSLVAIA